MRKLLTLFLGLLILSSCKKKEPPVAVASVTIDKGAAANVDLGSTLQLTATVLPENADSREVTWASSDPSIATVAGGLVTPVKQGEVTISATAGGITANCKVTVLLPFVAVTGVSMAPVTVSIVVRATSTLTATIAPENATDKKVVWTSDKENIATVSDGGVVTAIAAGTCNITAKSVSDPTKTATCAVTVVTDEIPVTGISVEPETATILVNETRQLSAIFAPATATNKSVTWSTSAAGIAEVSPTGLVTAKSEGTATITVAGVAAPSITAACVVTVTNRVEAVTGLTAAPVDTTVAVNTSFQLRHRITPATATNVSVTYESSDATKATVSGSGLVTTSATGQVTLTVKSVADPTKRATCVLTITPAPVRVQSITVSPNAADLAVGERRLLSATVMPALAANKTVIWSSADPTKASVSATGEVTAVALGEVSIIATAVDGSNITGSCAIKIVTVVAGITLDHTEVGIVVGENKTLVATIAPPTATNQNVVWISDKENIATISGGVITALATGTCTITAKSAADPTKTATCAVTVSAQAIAVTDISIAPAEATILVNQTRELTAVVLPETATNSNVLWSTSNPLIAEVSPIGVVTAKSLGTATITVISASNSAKTATCAITVTNQAVAITSFTAAPADTTITVGSSFELKARILPLNVTNVSVTFVSGDPEKALVSPTGLVTARTTGQATITVRSVADPTKMATCVLTIAPVPTRVQSITLSPATATLSIGQRQQFTSAILPDNAVNKTLTWATADPSKATVSSSGEVTAVASGQVVITATATDRSGIVGRATVTVRPRAASLTITPANPSVNVGSELPLSSTIIPSAALQTVTWSSGDQSKATINATTGVVLGVGPGTVAITATAADGSQATAIVTLTVHALPVSNAVMTQLTLGAENYVAGVPNPGGSTTLNNAPHTVASNIAAVRVNITATAGALIKIGTTVFSSGNTANFTNPVTFTVSETGKSGSKDYTLAITPYNATSNPYGIYTTAHLHDMRNGLTAGFKLMNDLTLPQASAGFTGISDYATRGWLPIGGETAFAGTMDGAGHKIDNLYASRTALYVGLFGRLGSGGTIKNLAVNARTQEPSKEVSGLNNAGQYTGILVGRNFGTIEDCRTTGVVRSAATTTAETHAHAGGLAGSHEGGQISRCYSTAIVEATARNGAQHGMAGGLVGFNSANITECYATGDVYSYGLDNTNSSAFSGGLLGDCRAGAINKCYAMGYSYAKTSSTSGSSGKGAHAGGLIGHSSAQINNCYAFGNSQVTATGYNAALMVVGGFVGQASGGTIRNSYSMGEAYADVAKSEQRYPGGFCGKYDDVTFTNCYRNWDAYVRANGYSVTPWDNGRAGITAEYISDMKLNTFKNKLNQGQATTVWGQGGEWNDRLPYIIGVGVGK